MKKILILAIAAVVLVSCGESKPMYFDETKQRMYIDTNAEFDTLSYVVGMNFGVGMSLQPSDIEYNRDIIAETLTTEFSKESVDYAFLEENSRLITRYQNEYARPYHMAKQQNGLKPMTTDGPVLYDEEYTKERVSEIYGTDYANYIRKYDFPVNIHWVIKAIYDAEAVTESSDVDSVMMLNTEVARSYMMRYTSQEHPEYNEMCTRRWLARVATQENVEMMVVEGDTLYYRINNPGNEIKPHGILDTVAFTYNVYTRSGRVVESLEERIKLIRENLNRALAEENILDSTSHKFYIDHLTKQLDMAQNLRVPLRQASIKGARYALQQIGEGGNITMWLPASLAYGARGNRAVSPNDGVVMEVTLKSVTHATLEEENGEGAPEPGKARIQAIPGSRALPMEPSPRTVTPADATE